MIDKTKFIKCILKQPKKCMITDSGFFRYKTPLLNMDSLNTIKHFRYVILCLIGFIFFTFIQYIMNLMSTWSWMLKYVTKCIFFCINQRLCLNINKKNCSLTKPVSAYFFLSLFYVSFLFSFLLLSFLYSPCCREKTNKKGCGCYILPFNLIE